MSLKTYGSALMAVVLTGCANMSTDPGTGSTRNSLISVAYGTVQNVQQVAMKPNYAEGSLPPARVLAPSYPRKPPALLTSTPSCWSTAAPSPL